MTATYATCVAFRGRDDTQTLDSTTFNYNQNTNWTQDADTTFRVRFEIEEQNAKLFSLGGQLQYNLNAAGWNNVTTSSSVVKAVVSAQFTDGDATTNILTGSAKTFAAGTGSEDGLAAAINLNNTHTEVEYSLQIVSANVADGDTVQLHIAALTADGQVPSITVNEIAWVPASDNQNAYTKGSILISDNQPAFTKGGVIFSDNQIAYTKGGISALDNQSAFIQGISTAIDSTNAYLEGANPSYPTSSSKSAYTKGKVNATPSIKSAYTKGSVVATPSNKSAYLKGGILATDNQFAYILGAAYGINSKSVFTQGSLTNIESKSAFTKGSTNITSSILAFLLGSISVNNSIHAYTEGYSTGGDAVDSQTAFLIGIDNNLVPDLDISKVGVWKNELDQTINLYQSIDETIADDNDYVYNTDPQDGDYIEFNLSNPSGTPGSGDVVIFFRAKSKTSYPIATVELRQGSTTIHSEPISLLENAQTYHFTLTPVEKSNITDWTDLRIRIYQTFN